MSGQGRVTKVARAVVTAPTSHRRGFFSLLLLLASTLVLSLAGSGALESTAAVLRKSKEDEPSRAPATCDALTFWQPVREPVCRIPDDLPYSLKADAVFEPFLADLKFSQSLFKRALTALGEDRNSVRSEINRGLCDSMSALFTLVSNDEMLGLMRFVDQPSGSWREPSRKHLAMLAFLLRERGLGLNETSTLTLQKSARKPFSLTLRTGHQLSAKSPQAMMQALREEAESGKVIYIGTFEEMIQKYSPTLPPGVYLLSLGHPLNHMVSFQHIAGAPKPLYFDSNIGVNERLTMYKSFDPKRTNCTIVAYGRAAAAHPLKITRTPDSFALTAAIAVQDLHAMNAIVVQNPTLLIPQQFSDTLLTGGAALHQAVIRDREATVAYLLQRNADPNLVTPGDKRTALYLAVSQNVSPAVVRLLLRNGADPNIADRSGSTPLLVAIMSERTPVEVVDALLNHGADPLISWKQGGKTKPLICIAVQQASPQVVERLLQDPRFDPGAPTETLLADGTVVRHTLEQFAIGYERGEGMLAVIRQAIRARQQAAPTPGTVAAAFRQSHARTAQPTPSPTPDL